jgi:hypothetical protein
MKHVGTLVENPVQVHHANLIVHRTVIMLTFHCLSISESVRSRYYQTSGRDERVIFHFDAQIQCSALVSSMAI